MKTNILIIGLCVVLASDGAAQTNRSGPASPNISSKAQNRKGDQGVKPLVLTNQVVAPAGTNAPTKAIPRVARPKPLAGPKEITTRDGKVYRIVKIEKVDPAGLTVSHSMAGGGLGIAKIPFAQLPPDWQKEYGYDPQAAAEFRSGEKQAAAQWANRMAAEEEAGRMIKAEREKQELEAEQAAAKAAADLAAQTAMIAATNPPPATNLNQQQPRGD
jgi:hypothetical protein